ncbi:hypothetical protein ACOT0B_17850 [Enterobacter cloacae complex sp. SHL008]|uniref:hypothetical protein n=1 Tax=Enterobacter cloacae complex TaxID=354276 RepID=UPI00300DB3AC
MNIDEFLIKYWDVIILNPKFFGATALLFLGIGFYLGRLTYITIINITKERLEAARDDLARMEKSRKDDSDTIAKLKDELFSKSQAVGIAYHEPMPESEVKIKVVQHDNIWDFKEKKVGLDTIESYFLSIPHRNIDDALAKAKMSKKLVFIVIYDEDHHDFSKLSYSLKYFLEYHTTKHLVDEYFVSALVKASDENAKFLIPDDEHLEQCLWVVMSPEQVVLRCEHLYANPDEGLKRVREVMAQGGMI